MRSDSIRVGSITNYIAVIILPATLFYLFINTNDSQQQNLHFIFFCCILILSYISLLIQRLNKNQPHPSDVILTRTWRGVAFIYILLSLWNYSFVNHLGETGYTSDCTKRRKFRSQGWLTVFQQGTVNGNWWCLYSETQGTVEEQVWRRTWYFEILEDQYFMMLRAGCL